MNIDVELRASKYAAFAREVIASGLSCEVLTGEADTDAIAIWGTSSPKPPRTAHGKCLIAFRVRGAFLLAGWSRVYRLPSTSAALDISRVLAATIGQVDYDDALATVVEKYALQALDMPSLHQADFAEQLLAWEKWGWFVLPQWEEKEIWERFSDRLLSPNGTLQPPVPALTWVVPDLLGEPQSARNIEELLTLAIFDSIKHCTLHGRYVFALDWDHPCYRFHPHQGARKPFRDYWAVPVWPRGGSYYFVDPEFEYGVLASHAGRLHIFGHELADASHSLVTALLGQPQGAAP